MLRVSWLFCLLCLLVAAACEPQGKTESVAGQPVRVQIPMWERGEYSLQVVELLTLKDLSALRGGAARFVMEPDTSSGQLKGREPNFRYFLDRNGVVVPTDDLSLQLLTVYAHFERLKALDEEMGIGQLLSYPRKVAFSSQVRSDTGEPAIDNAQYLGEYDAFLIVPYKQESLPLMANGGVIGHEHFHSIFQKLFIEPLVKAKKWDPQIMSRSGDMKLQARGQRPGRGESGSAQGLSLEQRNIFHQVLVRGINEGLADIWGWVYTGDSSFVGRSLPLHQSQRDLGTEPDELDSLDFLKDHVSKISPDSLMQSLPYGYGSQLSRLLRYVSDLQAQRDKREPLEARMRMGKAVLDSVTELQKDFASLKEGEIYSLSRAARVILSQVPDLHGKDCYAVLAYLPAKDPARKLLKSKCRDLADKDRGSD